MISSVSRHWALAALLLLPQIAFSFAPQLNTISPSTASSLYATLAPYNTDTTEDDSPAALRSITLANVNKDNEPDILCDFLLELRACSTAIIDANRGTDLEQPLFGEFESDRDPWQDSLQWAAPIWNRCNVTAHFPSSIDLKGVVDLIANIFPNQYPLADCNTVDLVPDRDWVIHVQKSWKPILIGPFVLRFPWHTKVDLAEAVVESGTEYSEEEQVELKLQGGIAFGTGEHPTTQLCLEWLHQQVKALAKENNGDHQIKIMDYGAGNVDPNPNFACMI